MQDRQGTWALCERTWQTQEFGLDAPSAGHPALTRDAMCITRDLSEQFLDVVRWRPLSTQWDYAKTRAHVRQELFADEWREA